MLKWKCFHQKDKNLFVVTQQESYLLPYPVLGALSTGVYYEG